MLFLVVAVLLVGVGIRQRPAAASGGQGPVPRTSGDSAGVGVGEVTDGIVDDLVPGLAPTLEM